MAIATIAIILDPLNDAVMPAAANGIIAMAASKRDIMVIPVGAYHTANAAIPVAAIGMTIITLALEDKGLLPIPGQDHKAA